MNLNEKVKYLISLVTQLVDNAKSIGQLDTHDPSYNSSDSYIAVYIGATQETKKTTLSQLMSDATPPPLPDLTYEDIEGIGDFKTINIEDSNEVGWRVSRRIDDVSEDSFKQDDMVVGFEDLAKTTYIEGVVLSPTAILPADIRDRSKFFITREVINI